MTDTANLGLPCIDAAQAQKHITHNEALRLLDTLVQLAVLDRDLMAPPGSPSEGQRWIVKAGATDAWAGYDSQVAAWQDGGWQLSAPKMGWVAYVVDEGALVAWNGSAWVDALSMVTSLQNMTLLGIGTTADSTNPFSAKLNNALWTATTVAEGGTGDLRYKLNKATAANTLSMLLQDNFSGRAEIGLTGDDDFHFKVSPDGSTRAEALTISNTNGGIRFLAVESDVASAATCDIGSAASLKVRITGTTTITSFGTVHHCLRLLRFSGALTLTNNATSLVLPTGANIVTAAGDCAIATSDGSGNWCVREYQRADGTALAGGTPNDRGMVNGFRNGTMDVWQRGTASMTVTTSGAYTADGWIVLPAGASVAVVAAAGRALTVNSLQVTGATSVTDVVVKQRIESYVAAPMTSQLVTVQAWVRNDTGGSITPTLTVKHANTQDGWGASTTDVSAVSLQACANAAWTQVAYTFTDAGNAANGLEISFDFGNNLSTSGKSIKLAECDIRVTPGVATGLNSSPPPAELRNIQHELAFCQRYYFRRSARSSSDVIGLGQAFSTTQAFGCIIDLPTQMRTTPTLNMSSASHITPFSAGGGTGGAFSGGALSYATTTSFGMNLSGSSGLAAGNCTMLEFNTTSGWLDAGAEL